MMKIIRAILLTGLITVIVISGYNLLKIYNTYKAEGKMHNEVKQYKPGAPEDIHTDNTGSEEQETLLNQSILDLQEKYKDAVGWITIPGTGIDYPFVQSADNSFYLRKDINGKYATAGTVFMDFRNNKDFTDFNTILYGHHMKNGTMFASLKQFNNKTFLDANKNGTVFLADKTYSIEFFAYMIVRTDDEVVYGIPADNGEKLHYIDHIKETAVHFRDIGITPADRIITLSTCSYEFKDARMVLIGRVDAVY